MTGLLHAFEKRAFVPCAVTEHRRSSNENTALTMTLIKIANAISPTKVRTATMSASCIDASLANAAGAFGSPLTFPLWLLVFGA